GGWRKTCSQCRLVSSVSSPLSTITQPSRSSRSHKLMWSSAKGRGMRSQLTPGATVATAPGAGGAAWGKLSAALPLSCGLMGPRALRCRLYALDDGRDPLADADAHRDQPVAPVPALQPADRGD